VFAFNTPHSILTQKVCVDKRDLKTMTGTQGLLSVLLGVYRHVTACPFDRVVSNVRGNAVLYGWGVWHLWDRGEVCAAIRSEYLKSKSLLKNVDIDGKVILKWILKK
jgi:hypothetical protein